MSDDESDDEDIDDIYYINPNSKIKFIIDILVLLSSIFMIISIPIDIAFSHALNESYRIIFSFLYWCGERIFVIDMISSFFIAYIDNNDELIVNPISIQTRYLCSWFFFDLLSIVPFAFFIDKTFLIPTTVIYQGDTHTYLHLLRLIKLIKLVKVLFNNAFFNHIIQSTIDSKFGKRLVLYITMFILLLSIHLLSSVFIFIGYHSHPNWITAQRIEPSNYFDIYVAGIYFVALTVFGIGYGDITPYNIKEKIFAMILLMIGIVIYSWLVSTLSKLKNIEYNNYSDEKINEY